MLSITVPEASLWDEGKQEFLCSKEQRLSLEHSLVSISKWESKWHRPFLSQEEKPFEEMADYIRCMTLTQNVDPVVYHCLTNENFEQVNAYIEDSMTATWFSSRQGPSGREQITSEIIYYQMISLGIPFECQKWHLNRLLTLIRVCSAKSQPGKKMGIREILSQNAALNAARRKRLNSKG